MIFSLAVIVGAGAFATRAIAEDRDVMALERKAVPAHAIAAGSSDTTSRILARGATRSGPAAIWASAARARPIELPSGTAALSAPRRQRRLPGETELGYVPGWEVHPVGLRAGSTPGAESGAAMSRNDQLYLQRRSSVVGDRLPLWGDKLSKAGVAFPLPLGVSFNYNWQRLRSRVTDLQVGLGDGPLRDIRSLDIAPYTTVTTYGGRLDVWLLPFLNVFFLGGYTESDSTTTVIFERLLPGRPASVATLPLVRSGPTFGGGFVVAGGYKQIFASGTFTWTETDLGEGSSNITARVAGLRVGWRFDGPRGAKFQLWGVGTYWDSARELEGSTRLPSGESLRFKLFQEPLTEWTFGLGARVDYRGMFEAIVEVMAFQDRTSVTFGLTARF